MFKEISISGSPFDRGVMHGDALAQEIARSIDFYAGVFKMPEATVLEHARHFRQKIDEFEPSYVEEIEGIAAGAGVNPLWIYALNARSEIISFNRMDPVNECTALYFKPTAVLGENWDWAQALEGLACLMHIELPDGWVYMLTEPGIIGKIGMNSHGIGTCLNFLTVDRRLEGLPIHIVLRALLECASLGETGAVVERAGLDKAGNILIGDSTGACRDLEFVGDRVYTLEPEENVMVHTNHCLGRHMHQKEDYPSSYARYEVAARETGALRSFTVEDMRNVLSDRSNVELPVYRPYVPDTELGAMGTVCTVIMELTERRFYLRRGNEENSGLELIFDGLSDRRQPAASVN